MKIRLLLLIMILISFVVRGQTIQEFASFFKKEVTYPTSFFAEFSSLTNKRQLRLPNKITLKFVFNNDINRLKYKSNGSYSADFDKMIGEGEIYERDVYPVFSMKNTKLLCFMILDEEGNNGECYLYSGNMQVKDKLKVAMNFDYGYGEGELDTYFLNDSTLVRVGDINENGTPIDKKWESVRLEKIKINKRRLKFEIQQQLIIKANTNNILDSISSYCKKLGLKYPVAKKK